MAAKVRNNLETRKRKQKKLPTTLDFPKKMTTFAQDFTTDMKIKTFVNRPIDENCYVVSDATGEGVIIDCGALFPDDQEAIADYIKSEGIRITQHILTHGHFDHMFGSQWVADTYGCRPKLHPADTDIYEGSVERVSAFFHRRIEFDVPRVGSFFNERNTLRFGTHAFRVIACPGHTPGGVCLYLEDEGVLFTGDSLFKQSIGRTDLEGGDHQSLIDSLTERVLTLPDSVKVYPGHGPSTTIADERRFNPYLPIV